MTASGKVRKPTVKKVNSFASADEAINQGIALFEDLSDKLNAKLERALALVEEIRKLCAERGINMPELEQATKDSNKLTIYATKLGRYLNEVKSEQASLEKKVAMISVMVDLGSQIEEVKLVDPKA